MMRIESTVTSISWIPSQVLDGVAKVPFELGAFHYDRPPPDRIRPEDLEALRDADRFRFANQLRAFVEVKDGRIVDFGHLGDGWMGSTLLRLGRRIRTVPGVLLPVLQSASELTEGAVRFEQTVGGRAGVQGPRPVNRPPYVQLMAPTVWTTLALTVYADGRCRSEMIGASPMPRHWIYDSTGRMTHKSGIVDVGAWMWTHTDQSPWGDYNAPAIVAEVESALERHLATEIMQSGERPQIRTVRVGENVTVQGERGTDLYLLLDGLLSVEVDGEPVAEVGPGAILGERAIVEGGPRTSTLRAVTPCKVAIARADQIDHEVLAGIAEGHRREAVPSVGDLTSNRISLTES